jgi:hypothetical protein
MSTMGIGFIVAQVCLLCAGNVHAYLDAGSGSYIIQVLIALAVGALYSIKVYWNRIREFLKTVFQKKKGRS